MIVSDLDNYGAISPVDVFLIILVPFYVKPQHWYALEIVANFECPFVQFHLKQNSYITPKDKLEGRECFHRYVASASRREACLRLSAPSTYLSNTNLLHLRVESKDFNNSMRIINREG